MMSIEGSRKVYEKLGFQVELDELDGEVIPKLKALIVQHILHGDERAFDLFAWALDFSYYAERYLELTKQLELPQTLLMEHPIRKQNIAYEFFLRKVYGEGDFYEFSFREVK